jgi:hypothetical protein
VQPEGGALIGFDPFSGCDPTFGTSRNLAAMTSTTSSPVHGAIAGRELLEVQINELMVQARSDDQMDRRGAARYPFFRPVTLTPAGGDLGPHHAFTRELSTTGVGLLHSVRLTPGVFTVAILHDDGSRTSLPTEILWCRPCGEGWYLSGGKFLLPQPAAPLRR